MKCWCSGRSPQRRRLRQEAPLKPSLFVLTSSTKARTSMARFSTWSCYARSGRTTTSEHCVLSRASSPHSNPIFQPASPSTWSRQRHSESLPGKVGPPDVFHIPHLRWKGPSLVTGLCNLTLTMPAGPVKIKKKFVLKGERTPQCGPFSLKLRVCSIRTKKSLDSLAQALGIGTRDLRRDIDAIGGVNVYRDNFRILPYGESGNDWIGLDSRRVQNPTLRLSNNQVSGYVFISAENNPLLVDQSNREGLFDNLATEENDLRELLIHATAELENARYEVRPRRETSKASREDDFDGEGGLFRGFTLDPVRKAAEDLHPTMLFGR